VITAAPDPRASILLVDDQPANLHVLTAALKSLYRLKIATSGQAALDLAAREDKPQLILLDVMMPVMSGIEVLRRLRADPGTADIPVIFVSADTSEQSQLDGLELGADDYLTKPVVTSILLARVRNLLDRKRLEQQLRLAAHVFQHSGEAIMITDRENRIVEINPAFTRMTGYTIEEVSGKNPRFLSSGRTSASEYSAMWQAISDQGFWQGEMWDRNKNGAVYPKLLTITVVKNRQHDIEYHIASFADISQQKAAEERIRHLAHHDPLTGLPNRLHLRIALEQSLAEAHRESKEVALMFLDLDRFKNINDTLGHHIGDRLLIEVANRLHDCVRESDLVARLGGDEFVVAVSGERAALSSAQIAEKIVVCLNRPFAIDELVLHTSPSIGISLYPGDGTDIETLMKNADTAMYHAKSAGRNNYQYFSVEMNQATSDRLRLENGLRHALVENQFTLHYQLQVDAGSGTPTGFEALVRWQHPQDGLVPPDRFIPVAEETGLILALGDWVLDTACAQLRAWQDAGQTKLRMAVNLSLHQLRTPGLAERVAETLARHGLSGADLELEITESAAMQDARTTIGVLNQLRELGVTLAIDDFGTGHSSLAYLKLLPVQRLKLDRSFVKDIETDPNDASICSATIALAHALGLDVLAEGVETEAQRDFLGQLGCDAMQGYLFSRPVPAEAALTAAIGQAGG
jgi:diguanylate cyclase (GGDEF)-like protein/PAS domain S-box-containing protein